MSKLKHKLVIGEIVEKRGKLSFSQAMINAGYSVAYAKNPKQLLETDSFQEELSKAGITDEKLMKVLNEGLEANKAVVMGTKSEESFVDIQPDHPTRHKFMETGWRLKGRGANSKEDKTPQPTGDVNIQNNFFDPNSAEVKRITEDINRVMMKATEPKDD